MCFALQFSLLIFVVGHSDIFLSDVKSCLATFIFDDDENEIPDSLLALYRCLYPVHFFS